MFLFHMRIFFPPGKNDLHFWHHTPPTQSGAPRPMAPPAREPSLLWRQRRENDGVRVLSIEPEVSLLKPCSCVFALHPVKAKAGLQKPPMDQVYNTIFSCGRGRGVFVHQISPRRPAAGHLPGAGGAPRGLCGAEALPGPPPPADSGKHQGALDPKAPPICMCLHFEVSLIDAMSRVSPPKRPANIISNSFPFDF